MLMGLPKLTKERANQQLNEQQRDIECVEEPSGYKTKIKWKCYQGHVWESTPHTVLTSKHGCPACTTTTNLSVDNKLLKLNLPISRIGDVANSRTPVLWLCKSCNNKWMANPNKILRQDTSCPRCSRKQRLTNEIVDQRLSLSPIKRAGDVVNVHTKIKWMCERGHVWSATPNAVINKGTGCPYCYSERGGHGTPIYHDGLYFRSHLEYKAYCKLIEYTKEKGYTLELQKRYTTHSKHTCDFYIPEIFTWIEISNYSSANYMKNISKKRKWVNRINENFIFTDDIGSIQLP